MNKKVPKNIPVVLTKHYDFVAWVLPHLSRFPKNYKFLLGDRMQSAILDVLEDLIDASYSREKGDILQRVNLRLEKLRYMFRLSNDLALLDQRRYLYAVESLNEIGRMTGGWIKATQSKV